jgi:hypothetical protein
MMSRHAPADRICVAILLSIAFLEPSGAGASGVFGAASCPHIAPVSHRIRTGGITYPLSKLRHIQAAVDHGNRCLRYYLNPVQVTGHDLPLYGFSAGPITVISPPAPHVAPTAHRGEDGLPETDVVVRYRGHQYWIVLNQFIRHGPGGIWSIITITPM